VEERFDSVEGNDKDDVFQVKTQPSDDAPFAFPIECVGAGVSLVYERSEIPEGLAQSRFSKEASFKL
jgi:hypothetical protein